MDVPSSEERLRSGLNRFSTAASEKHTHVVIVIGGTNLIRNKEIKTGTLHWIPCTIRKCFLVIFSTIEYEEINSREELDESKHRDNFHRTYTELKRRNV